MSLTPHYHFHLLHRYLGISWEITAENLPLHIASSWTQTRNLIYTYVILIYIYIACIYILLTYTVEMKENALIIHSAMKTWRYTIIRNFIILCLCLFSKISPLP